jgi:hypothetical protein
LNGRNQLLVFADGVNLLGHNINTIKKNTEASIATSKEGGLELNTKKTMLSYRQNARRNHNIEIHNRFFETVAKFNYFGTTVTNTSLIHKEIKWRLNSGNACNHLVQNPLSSRLLYKNVKIKINKTIVLPVVLCGCETWTLTLKEED